MPLYDAHLETETGPLHVMVESDSIEKAAIRLAKWGVPISIALVKKS